MEELLVKLSEAISVSPWLGPVAALVSGVLTSLMPCSLSTIPLIIGYVGSSADSDGNKNSGRAFFLSLLFALGASVVFCVLGFLASALGSLLEKSEFVMHIIMALLLVLMALQMWGVINIIPSGSSIMAKNRLHGGIGAFIAGLLSGLFASHCALPVVIALLTVAVNTGKSSPVYGLILLLFFSVGHAVLSVVAGTSIGFVQKLMSNPKYERASKIVRILLGAVILLIAVYLLVSAFVEGAHAH